MAARLRARHQDEIREKIRASQLVNRLENHAFGELELSPSQIKAIEILLNKCVPNLSQQTLSGDEDNPLTVVNKIERAIIDPNN